MGGLSYPGDPGNSRTLLGRDLIYLETNNNDAAVRALDGLQSIRDVKLKSKGFVLMVNEDGSKVLPLIIDTLRNAGIEISTINLKKPSMDDVFVYYTGREYRDQSPAKASFLRAGGR